METLRRHTKRTLIGIVGGLVVLVGLVLIPYPGPGWLVVFAGLAILATEFEFASRWLAYGRKKYDAWVAWLARQHWGVQAVVLMVMGVVIVLTIWLLNGFGVVVKLLDIPWPWAVSPLFR